MLDLPGRVNTGAIGCLPMLNLPGSVLAAWSLCRFCSNAVAVWALYSAANESNTQTTAWLLASLSVRLSNGRHRGTRGRFLSANAILITGSVLEMRLRSVPEKARLFTIRFHGMAVDQVPNVITVLTFAVLIPAICKCVPWAFTQFRHPRYVCLDIIKIISVNASWSDTLTSQYMCRFYG